MLALHFVFAGLVGIVAAQGSLPACADSCLKASTPAQGDCSNVDIGCLCSNVGYINVLACCLSKNCNEQDQQVAQAFNQALCAGVNVIIPSFLGCGNNTATSSTSQGRTKSSTAPEAGIEFAIKIPQTTAIANFNGHPLLTGTCSVAHPVLATLDNGGLMEYPRLGCSNEEPGCCPFDIQIGGALSVCPDDYSTTSGACCPSGWSVYSSVLAGQTPCFSTTPLTLVPTTTLNINARALALSTPTPPSIVGKTIKPRAPAVPAVSVITTHLFTYKYDLAPQKVKPLSTGAIAGIVVGAGVGGIMIIGLLAGFIFRLRQKRREQRAMAAGSAFASRITSPVTGGGISTHPASVYSHATHQSPPPMGGMPYMPSSRVGTNNMAGNPPLASNVTPQELPGVNVPFEQHPGFSPSGGRFE